MEKTSKIYIAGHNGLVGSALQRNLIENGYENLLIRSHSELNLTNQAETNSFFSDEKPEYVFLAAAKVGGIFANNTYRADFIYNNIQIQTNVIQAAYLTGVEKLMFFGSSCIYPRNISQPISEESLLCGDLEPTSEPYAIAKIAGVKMCESYFRQYGCNYLSVMPCNLFGTKDNYDFDSSHVLAALIRKFYLANCLEKNKWEEIRKNLLKHSNINSLASNKEILSFLSKQGICKEDNKVSLTLWGSGETYREFMHSDDLAEICVQLMNNVDAKDLFEKYQITHINIGTNKELKIKELAELIRNKSGFNGEIIFNNKYDGIYRKLLSTDKLKYYLSTNINSVEEGIDSVFESYIYNKYL